MSSSKRAGGKSGKKSPFAVTAIISLIFLVVILAGGGFYTLYLLGLVNFVDTDNDSFDIDSKYFQSEAINPDVEGFVPDDPVKINDIAKSVEEIEVQGNTKVVTNILLLGIETDNKDNYKGRSDTIIILSINKHTKTVKLISLLRDTYVTVPGRERDKLTHTFSYGGFSLLSRTIEKNFRLKIDKFVAVNFSAFSTIVDAMGGVDIDLTEKEAEILKLGSQAKTYHLNGQKALDYSRIRKIGDDWGRTSRQRNVLKALMNKAKGMSQLEYPGILNKLLSKASTNMSEAEFLGYIVSAPSYLKYDVIEHHHPTRSECKGVKVPIPKTEYYMEALEFVNPKQTVLDLHHEIYG
jgi:LCP family protein required for cell wall assembly